MVQERDSNRFKFLGLSYIVSGSISAVLGIILFLSIKQHVESTGSSAWYLFYGGIYLLTFGFYALLIKGLPRFFRSPLGKDTPGKLMNKDLVGMLYKRSNSTFYEAREIPHKLLESIFPRLSETPHWIRMATLIVFDAMLYSVFWIVLVGFALFAAFTGLSGSLFDIHGLFIGLTFILFYVWLNTLPRIIKLSRRLEISENEAVSLSKELFQNPRSLALKFAIVILLPIIVPKIGTAIFIHSPSFSIIPWFAITFVFILITCGSVLYLLKNRMPKEEFQVGVSNINKNWQAQIHPKQLFYSLEAYMKKYGFTRYFIKEPDLKAEGSTDKGGFFGEVLYESSLQLNENDLLDEIKIPIKNITIISHVAFILGACWLFISLLVVKIMSFSVFFIPLLAFTFGTILSQICWIYWREFHYESILVFLKITGTYTESTLKSGSAVYDSHTSENKVVSSDIHADFLISRIRSTSLQGIRSVIEMHETNDIIDEATQTLEIFIAGRQTVAGFNQPSLLNASSITQMNQLSRPSHESKPLPSLVEEEKKLSEHNIVEQDESNNDSTEDEKEANPGDNIDEKKK